MSHVQHGAFYITSGIALGESGVRHNPIPRPGRPTSRARGVAHSGTCTLARNQSPGCNGRCFCFPSTFDLVLNIRWSSYQTLDQVAAKKALDRGKEGRAHSIPAGCFGVAIVYKICAQEGREYRVHP